MKPSTPMWGEGDGESNTIDKPPKYDFCGGPSAITFEKLFQRRWFLAVLVLRGQRAEDGIDRMQENTFGPPTPFAIALNQLQEIIDIYVGIGKRLAGRGSMVGG
jgi:hypothetical protein